MRVQVLHDREMLLARSGHRTDVDGLVKGHEAPLVLDGEREQVEVGDLARAHDPRAVDADPVENRQFISPELVVAGVHKASKQVYYRLRRERTTSIVGRVRHDSDDAVLGQWARRPPLIAVCVPPGMRPSVKVMVWVQERDHNADVEQRSH